MFLGHVHLPIKSKFNSSEKNLPDKSIRECEYLTFKVIMSMFKVTASHGRGIRTGTGGDLTGK